MSNQVELVFTGEILPGFELTQVKASLAGLLKLDLSKADALFSGQRVVLKKELPAAEADRYVQHLAKLGARVQAIAIAPALLSLDDFEVAPAAPAQASTSAKPAIALETRAEPVAPQEAPRPEHQPSPQSAVAIARPAVTTLQPVPDQQRPEQIYQATQVAESVEADDNLDYEKIAYWQKAIIYLVVLSFVAVATQVSSPLIGAVLMIIAGLGQLVGVFQLTTAMQRHILVRIGYLALMFIPLISLICLVLLSSRATKLLREGGYEVGFLGVKETTKKTIIVRKPQKPLR